MEHLFANLNFDLAAHETDVRVWRSDSTTTLLATLQIGSLNLTTAGPDAGLDLARWLRQLADQAEISHRVALNPEAMSERETTALVERALDGDPAAVQSLSYDPEDDDRADEGGHRCVLSPVDELPDGREVMECIAPGHRAAE